ncbi:hypothetical protein [Paenarthrobacter nitroguajacolicus]|uniref:hypothetical protein n=1 Tax=Paenarthrobacter nitroguajacolicus TaxID=211146 RepID=UPI0040542B55
MTRIPLDSSRIEAASMPSPQPALSPPAVAGFQPGPTRHDAALGVGFSVYAVRRL